LKTLLFLLAAAAAPTPTMPAASPAQVRIERARAAIQRDPRSPRAYVDLAWGLARRALETSDHASYREAGEAVAEALRLSPGDHEAQKARVWVLLGQHEFARALDEAKALNRRVPDDLIVYGLLSDAHVELGQYKEAEAAVQWILDMRPGTVSGLTRGAHLRELFGDVHGALELMGQAFDRTPMEEVEDRAWILTQIAHLYVETGKLETAEAALDQALGLFPGYHYALAQLAKVRAGQGRYAEAAELLGKRYQAAPHPENLYDLGEALRRAGRKREARDAFAEFEAKARAEMEGADNANRELIAYYVDRAHKPAEALRIARREVSRRRDVYTLDAYAWALQANGQVREARAQMNAALAVGVRDSKLLYHAGVIKARLGDREAAARDLRDSLALGPDSEVAAAARAALKTLGRTSPTRPRPTAVRAY